MKIKLKNVRPLARRGKRVGNEDELLAYLMNSNNTVYSPTGGYNVQFAPTAENRDYQAVGLPAAQIVGQSPNPQARYVNQLANQISQQRGVGNNNDYFRTVGILNNIMKDKKYVGKDGALNQQGWAKLAQDQMFGPGSDWYKRHSQSAKDVASGLAQVAMLPYAAGMGGLELLGSVGGGALGATIGTNIGQNFDNPYTGNYAGSELGGLLGGVLGGVSGANIRGLGRAYIRGMNNLANRQDYYWMTRGIRPDGTKPSAAEINAVYPIESRGNNLIIEPTGKNIEPRATTKAQIRYMPGVKRAKANAIRERYQQKMNDDILTQEELDWQQAYKDYNPTEDDIKFYNTLKMLSEKEPTPFLQNNPEYNTYYETMQLTPQIKENMLRDAKQYGRTYVDNRYLYKYGGPSKGPIGKKLNTLLNKAKQSYTNYILNNIPASEQTINYLEQLPKMPIDNFDNVRNQIARRYYEPIRDDQRLPLTIGLRLANAGYGVANKYNAALDNIAYKLRSKKEYGGRVKFPGGGTWNFRGITMSTGRPQTLKEAYPLIFNRPVTQTISSPEPTVNDQPTPTTWNFRGIQMSTNPYNQPTSELNRTPDGLRNYYRTLGFLHRLDENRNLDDVNLEILGRNISKNAPELVNSLINEYKNSVITQGLVDANINKIRNNVKSNNNRPKNYSSISQMPRYNNQSTAQQDTATVKPTPRQVVRQTNNNIAQPDTVRTSTVNNNVKPNVARTDTARTDTIKAKAPAKPATQIATNDTVKAKQVAKEPVNKPESPAKAVRETDKTQQTTNKGTSLSTKYTTSDTASIPKNEDYTVIKGDSPWKIADKAGITINTLYELNPGMEKRGVYVGDSVNLTRNITNDQQIKKVTKRGDSPWAIAHRYGMTLDEFYKLNPNAKSRGVYIGDEFVVNKNRSQKKYGGAVRRRLESGGQLSY